MAYEDGAWEHTLLPGLDARSYFPYLRYRKTKNDNPGTASVGTRYDVGNRIARVQLDGWMNRYKSLRENVTQ